MPYTPLNYHSVRDPELKEVFEHADKYLYDVYGMFRRLPPEDGDGGKGQFSIVLVLLCVIDGLATDVWPGKAHMSNQNQRFKHLLRKRLHWGPEGQGKWARKDTATTELYVSMRNPMVHQLAANTGESPPRIKYTEPVIGKWGPNIIPPEMRDIAKIDALSDWNDAWPIMFEEPNHDGTSRFRLVAAGLYWAIKKLANELAAERSN